MDIDSSMSESFRVHSGFGSEKKIFFLSFFSVPVLITIGGCLSKHNPCCPDDFTSQDYLSDKLTK